MKELFKAIAIPSLIFIIGQAADYYGCTPVKVVASFASLAV